METTLTLTFEMLRKLAKNGLCGALEIPGSNKIRFSKPVLLIDIEFSGECKVSLTDERGGVFEVSLVSVS